MLLFTSLFINENAENKTNYWEDAYIFQIPLKLINKDGFLFLDYKNEQLMEIFFKLKISRENGKNKISIIYKEESTIDINNIEFFSIDSINIKNIYISNCQFYKNKISYKYHFYNLILIFFGLLITNPQDIKKIYTHKFNIDFLSLKNREKIIFLDSLADEITKAKNENNKVF